VVGAAWVTVNVVGAGRVNVVNVVGAAVVGAIGAAAMNVPRALLATTALFL